MNSKGFLRQGDILLIPLERKPEANWERELEREDGRLVLERGEATGHAHAVLEDNARLVDLRRDTGRRGWMGKPLTEEVARLLVVEGDRGVFLTHEEHDAIAVAPGLYEVRRQREYRSERERRWVWVND